MRELECPSQRSSANTGCLDDAGKWGREPTRVGTSLKAQEEVHRQSKPFLAPPATNPQKALGRKPHQGPEQKPDFPQRPAPMRRGGKQTDSQKHSMLCRRSLAPSHRWTPRPVQTQGERELEEGSRGWLWCFGVGQCLAQSCHHISQGQAGRQPGVQFSPDFPLIHL